MKRKTDDITGQVVFIGRDGKDHDRLVFVTWTPFGGELSVLDCVREAGYTQAMVIGATNKIATPTDVETFKAAHKRSWSHGYWFERTPKFTRAMVMVLGNREVASLYGVQFTSKAKRQAAIARRSATKHRARPTNGGNSRTARRPMRRAA